MYEDKAQEEEAQEEEAQDLDGLEGLEDMAGLEGLFEQAETHKQHTLLCYCFSYSLIKLIK